MKSTLRLNNGRDIPILGLGTWQGRGKDVEKAVLHALKIGYRHIDTAAIYGNEVEVGNAIRKSGIPREEIFLTTKLWNDDHADVEKAFNESLKKLGLDYVDLYLMHWPVKERLKSWKVMERLCKEGKCKAIGISNFTIKHMEEFLPECSIRPAVNQFELNPYLNQKELVKFCKDNDILVEAYCPLTRGQKLDDIPLVEIAKRYSKTTAQILIRWCIEQDIVVIPKSTTTARIKENSDVFDFSLDDDDMKIMDSFHCDLRLCWNPTNAE